MAKVRQEESSMPESVGIRPEEKEVTAFEEAYLKAESAVAALAVVDAESNAVAAQYLSRLKDISKQADEKRKALVRPLQDHVKFIDGLFKPTMERAEKLRRVLEEKMLNWSRAERQAREEAERAARAAEAEAARKEAERLARNAARTKDDDKRADKEAAAAALEQQAQDILAAPVAPVKAAPVVEADGTKTTIRKTWAWEITDENAIPRNFLVVDNARLTNAVRAGIREIPGVRVYEKEQVVTR